MLSPEASMNYNLLAIKHQRSLITDHHNKYNNKKKKFELWESAKCGFLDVMWGNIIGKMVSIHLLDAELPQIFNLWKAQFVKECSYCASLYCGFQI